MKRFLFIFLTMLVAFIVLVCAIVYDGHHPMTDTELQTSRGIQP